MKDQKLFGTDGIRGLANHYPMTIDTVSRVGQALGHLIMSAPSDQASRKKVVIGKDTRLSGYMVEMALSSGLNSMGVDVQLVGPLPTPGIGFLTRNMRANAGIVISASHNAFQDNGIKIFGNDGFKISTEWEKAVEELVGGGLEKISPPISDGIGRSKRIDDSAGRYVVYVKNTFPHHMTLDGLRIVLDCAHGAAYKVGPAILEELGAEVFVLGNTPNGLNINDKCGALHPAKLAEAVQKYRADVGISLDGDADRVIMVDERGNIVNGDHILAICGLHLKRKNLLKNNTLVTTQMANFGLDQLMKQSGITLIKTDVGDRWVVEEMRKSGHILGGESSGHIIFLDHSTTGDGLIAALNVLAVMKEQKESLSRLASVMKEVPQVLRNIRVSSRVKLSEVSGYDSLVQKLEKKLAGQGRIFVRFSGTEPLLRILVEGNDLPLITQIADEIGVFLQKELA